MGLKYCPKCKKTKSLAEFRDARVKNKIKKRTYCSPCEVIYTREYERRRRKEPEYLERKRVSSEKQHKKLREVFNQNKWDYLSKHPCVDCGERDPVVLDFDHRDPKTKKFTIAGGRKRTWDEILTEINKCDVRCANCHRKKTAKQLGWYPGLI